MCLAVLLFAANDTLGKILLGTYTVGQTMIVRGVVGLAVLLPLRRRPRLVLTAQQLLATMLYGCVVTVFEGWTWPGPVDAALLVVLGLGSMAGNLCVNIALRLGPAISVVPFQYTMLLWGIVFGWVIFG